MAGHANVQRSAEASKGSESLTTPYYVLESPFNDWGEDHMKTRCKEYVVEKGLEDYEKYFVNGGLLNLSGEAFLETRDDGLKISSEEQTALKRESPKLGAKNSGFWRKDRALFSQSGTLYKLVVLCSAAAAGTYDDTCPCLLGH